MVIAPVTMTAGVRGRILLGWVWQYSPQAMSDTIFLLKVMALSALLGIGIKYGLPILPWPLDPSLELALGLLVAPSMLMAGLLWGWSVTQRPKSEG